jgi:hypothetical protein
VERVASDLIGREIVEGDQRHLNPHHLAHHLQVPGSGRSEVVVSCPEAVDLARERAADRLDLRGVPVDERPTEDSRLIVKRCAGVSALI